MPKLNPVRTPIHHLEPVERTKGFQEIERPYTLEEALAEANRCILCPKPKCVEGCPAHNDIPGFIKAILDQDFASGIRTLYKASTLSGVCSRVCDHARQCEGSCVVGKRGDPVAIGMLERFLADWEIANEKDLQPEPIPPATEVRVAVVGSGPAGLACARTLRRLGHRVTVFEAMPVAGGVLAWGIPLFRLPQDVLAYYVHQLQKMGVSFSLNTKIGRDISLGDLFRMGYRAVFLGVGVPQPTSPNIPGEDLKGVYDSTSFLTNAKLSRTLESPDFRTPEVGTRVAVIGAGNTAMDAATTALRLDTKEVSIVYRRSMEEAPARREEVKGAMEEGVNFRFLSTPVRFLGDGGKLKAMECIQMKLGEPDASGRRRPIPIPGSEFTLEVDTAVLALGYEADPVTTEGTSGVDRDKWGQIVVNKETMQTSYPGVWAAGDIVNGADTVVRAMAQGIVAARSIHSSLTNQEKA